MFSLEVASFGISLLSLLYAIIALGLTRGLSSIARLSLCMPGVLAMFLFAGIGFWAILNPESDPIPQTEEDIEAVIEQLTEDIRKTAKELFEAEGGGRSPVPPIQEPVIVQPVLPTSVITAADTATAEPTQVPSPSTQPTSSIATTVLPFGPINIGGSGSNNSNLRESTEAEGGVSAASGDQIEQEKRGPTPTPPPRNTHLVGNLVVCIPSGSWVRLYRIRERHLSFDQLLAKHQRDEEVWEQDRGRFTRLEGDPRRHKIDGLSIDATRFGQKGEPYRIELVTNNEVVRVAGDIFIGQEEFLIYPNLDNADPWPCR